MVSLSAFRRSQWQILVINVREIETATPMSSRISSNPHFALPSMISNAIMEVSASAGNLATALMIALVSVFVLIQCVE